MDITRAAALKLWETQFGKKVDALDFAGRKLQKGAYDQLNSSFGWTLTEILPKENGGKTEPDNLICAHIKTKAEKALGAETFPFFKANDVRFEIKTDGANPYIEPASDDEAAAEQKAKFDSAMAFWDQTFGEESGSAEDFCGRTIVRNDFGTDLPTAWKIAPFVETKPTENKNAYIANVLSVEEAIGKTAFKANGKQFALNKENGVYFFKETEQRSKKKGFDVYSPRDVDTMLANCAEEFSSPDNQSVWLDFVAVKATLPNTEFPIAAALSDSLSTLVKEHSGNPLSLEVDDLLTEDGTRRITFYFRFLSFSVQDMEKCFDLSMLLNTYAGKFSEAFGLTQFKIYDYTDCFSTAFMNYSVPALACYYPQFGAFISAISDVSPLHENETDTTLYISQYVIGNIASLAEIHGENEPAYTDAVLFEHNFIFGLENKDESEAEETTEDEFPETEPANEAPTFDVSEGFDAVSDVKTEPEPIVFPPED